MAKTMRRPFTTLFEISHFQAISTLKGEECAGFIAPLDIAAVDIAPLDMTPPDPLTGHYETAQRFARLPPNGADLIADPAFSLPRYFSGLAIEAPEGIADIEKASALLRVYEARTGQPDHMITLFAFLYQTPAALAQPFRALSAPKRLQAIAWDEDRFAAEFDQEAAPPYDVAPRLYARARLVAEARKLGVPAYLKSAAEHARESAMRDGFDGLITMSASAP